MDNRELYYTSMSKYQLVDLLKQRGRFKYAFSRTKPEIIKILCDYDRVDELEKRQQELAKQQEPFNAKVSMTESTGYEAF